MANRTSNLLLRIARQTIKSTCWIHQRRRRCRQLVSHYQLAGQSHQQHLRNTTLVGQYRNLATQVLLLRLPLFQQQQQRVEVCSGAGLPETATPRNLRLP